MKTSVQYVTDQAGKKTGVLLKLADYEQLIEDLRDLATIAARRDEPTIPHKKFLEELRKDGMLQD
ncbi:MAG: hypothetical protein GKR87_09760 [Kiritimatiellae bacterium]|nr:hypothetical protein [Kiritimatiellia bacterium]